MASQDIGPGFQFGEEPPWEDEYDFEMNDENFECEYCHGTGGDPYNDGCTPCPKCDGEGYKWWL